MGFLWAYTGQSSFLWTKSLMYRSARSDRTMDSEFVGSACVAKVDYARHGGCGLPHYFAGDLSVSVESIKSSVYWIYDVRTSTASLPTALQQCRSMQSILFVLISPLYDSETGIKLKWKESLQWSVTQLGMRDSENVTFHAKLSMA